MKHDIRCILLIALLITFSGAPGVSAQAIKTEVVRQDGKWALLRDGKPYFIKGVGGGGPLPLLAQLGGNSVRTWGAEHLDAELDEAQKLGLSVAVGLWLGQERAGFNYNDPKQVADQFQTCKQWILKYKDHPAVLMWSIGNEMEGYQNGDNPAIWKAVNDIAAMAKQVDPNHPTMTVIAEIGGARVKSINQFCPSIDIIGINSYAGCASIPKRYVEAGGTKPYVITEFGVPGTWETPKTSYGAVQEPTSTEKAESYRRSYEQGIASQPGLCFGSYAFTWGWKQEGTLTWFGMILPDGSKTEAVETMGELWSGKPAANHAPTIEPLKLQGSDTVEPGQVVTANLKTSDPDGDPVKVTWLLTNESTYGSGGDRETPIKRFPNAIVKSDNEHAEVKLPSEPGIYRLYAYARDDHGHCAVANIPMLVKKSEATSNSETPAKAKLVIYADGMTDAPYAPTGWMGKTDAIAIDPQCKVSPHSGATCMKLDYRAADNFGGIAWQDPPNDWGDKPGGHDLTGAKRLSFWARGDKGGEKVQFKFGILGADKKFPDSASGETTVDLTNQWKQYTIDLSGKDLSRIKTGFCWVVAGQGAPITFYLDDVQYE